MISAIWLASTNRNAALRNRPRGGVQTLEFKSAGYYTHTPGDATVWRADCAAGQPSLFSAVVADTEAATAPAATGV
jgi:hypothetical protein